ncbi:MAG: glycosyl hydrolase [Gammaproteobacteria bacterium]|nr:glycosyl hydrolase [Gammaproteobacteria bacterium]MBU0786607.1 glycosyl hydrolase [Gammaproteobacteria bacterium]MBU0814322.1 glycosyl hydrolase [Gammaproteobacteria bacterium]MBU1786158.1 glycosyl hydrolase [Gammaproteobacteria bacterium]
MRPNKTPLHSLLVTAVLASAVSLPLQARESVELTHVHGLSYNSSGKQIMIPSHHGMAIFEGGHWSMAPGPAHDFMGFSATRSSMYSSGHPAPGSNMTNPFGVIKSRDGGKTWQKLGLDGESDFHTLATSYGTNAVYVINHRPNSRMPTAGIYSTRNDGLQWSAASAGGIKGDIASMAVHPTDADIVAVGTADGIFLSRDSGNNFKLLAGGTRALAATFDLDGKSLWVGTYDSKAGLARIALTMGAKAQALTIPPLTEDAVAYIAQNPVSTRELVIATFKRNVFLSKDQGQNWKQIAKNGETLE